MAAARSRPPKQGAPPPSAIATVAGGLIGGAPAAAASGGALAAGAKATRTAVQKAIAAVLAILDAITIRRNRMIRDKIAMAFPTSDIEKQMTEEARREVVFRKLVEQRMRVGMKLAMEAKDPSARAAAIQNVLNRERRFAEQRSRASGERVLAAAEFQELRSTSPQGALWLLGPRKEHTPDCVAMAGKFWPWSILEEVHPLLHVGCGCYLISFGEAIKRGLMKPDQILSAEAAAQMAAPVIQHVREEAAEAEKKYGHLAEESALEELLLREALLARGADPDLMAAAPLGVDHHLFELADTVEEERPAHLQEADEKAAGAMVALYPSPEKAKRLAISKGEEPEQLHVTLAFLGKADDLDFDAALGAVEAWAKRTPRLHGKVSGIGHFDLGEGKKATYASMDLPKLPAPREDLVKQLDAAGVPAKKDHGFTPHMTLDYKMRRPPVEQERVGFNRVCLTWGEDQHFFELTGGRAPKRPVSEPPPALAEDFDPEQPRDLLGKWQKIIDAPGTEKIHFTDIKAGDVIDLQPSAGKQRVRVAVRKIIHTDKKGRPTFSGTRVSKHGQQGVTTNYGASVNSDITRHGNVDTGSVEPVEGDFLPATPAKFAAAIEEQMGNDKRRPYLTPYSAKDYEGMTTFLSADGKTGGALKKTDEGTELVSLFNKGEPGAGRAMAKHLIAQGADRLDCLGPDLADYYSDLGFKVTETLDWDPAHAPEGWQDGPTSVYVMER